MYMYMFMLNNIFESESESESIELYSACAKKNHLIIIILIFVPVRPLAHIKHPCQTCNTGHSTKCKHILRYPLKNWHDKHKVNVQS